MPPSGRPVFSDSGETAHFRRGPRPLRFGEMWILRGQLRLKRSRLKVRFCTNESQKSRADLVGLLRRLGFDVSEGEVTAPAPAACLILKQRGLRPHLLIDTSNPNCVVIADAGEGFSYQNMNKAFQVLMELENPVLFSLGKGRYYKETSGLMLDVGPYMKALEYACGIEAEVVGKPSPEFFKSALQEMGVEAHEAIMIGDDIVGDVGGAQRYGMRALQVRTGKFRLPTLSEGCGHGAEDIEARAGGPEVLGFWSPLKAPERDRVVALQEGPFTRIQSPWASGVAHSILREAAHTGSEPGTLVPSTRVPRPHRSGPPPAACSVYSTRRQQLERHFLSGPEGCRNVNIICNSPEGLHRYPTPIHKGDNAPLKLPEPVFRRTAPSSPTARPSDEHHPEVKADGYVDNLAEAVDLLLQHADK
ncbi:hypothetical protein E5288_WYG006216 [Bos mutus]|uniref:Phospholysine phosphohistidine inorganic pyrophosphate phosphatase n=1 Tax=Bos mutus TaxID=72004 RepID=A0A6B0QRF0_9CETA|nr:hypothetical protein [Bos mutus]